MGKIVNQTELAAILGVTDVTIWEWQKVGMPIIKRGERGTSNEYDTAVVIDWRIAREIEKAGNETQRDRLARLQGDMLEIELAAKNKVLVPFTEIEPVWKNRVLSAAMFLTGEPSRLAGILEATPGVEKKREVLKREFEAFLTRLGVNGERMQQETEDLLASFSANEAEAFIKRLSAHDVQQNAVGSAEPGVEAIPPPAQDPAIGMG